MSGEARRLPTRIPIFPLTGALLLPLGRLPLNIFEPRYLAMVEDAIKGDRIIGMVQPQAPDAESHEEEPSVYGVGCAGRITLFRETRDNRFEIVLDGLSRFEIVREAEGGKGYRVAEVRWQPFAVDTLAEDEDDGIDSPMRKRLLGALETFLSGRGASMTGTGIAELPDRELVAAIAMSCPFAPNEKQALLEAKDSADCAERLVSLLEMAAFEGAASPMSRQ